MLFELGMMYSVGRDVPVDLVSAHKWFNLAAAKGNGEAVRLRREIAAQMTDGEIAIAQRAARDWLRLNKNDVPVAADAPALAALNIRLACQLRPLSWPVRQACAMRTDTYRRKCPGLRIQGVPTIQVGHRRGSGNRIANLRRIAGGSTKPANCRPLSARKALMSGKVSRCSCG